MESYHHLAKPFLVAAWRIVEVEPEFHEDQVQGSYLLTLDGIENNRFEVMADACGNVRPEEGDYYVELPGSNHYMVLPPAQFEAMFSQIPKRVH